MKLTNLFIDIHMKTRLIPYGIAALLLVSFFSNCDTTNTSTVNHTTDTIVQTVPAKSKEEVMLDEAAKLAETAINKGLENRRYKDSVHAANKDDFWVMKIGKPFKDLDKMAEAYEKIKDLEKMENLAVFDQSGEYTIIKIGNSEEELLDLQGAVKEELRKADTDIISIKVENILCGRREHVVTAQSRKLKRRYPEINCYSCN
jgi:hypothetical protein